MNLENLAREVAVSARAIANYFDILQDTVNGSKTSGLNQGPNRRLIKSNKFYYFDVGWPTAWLGESPGAAPRNSGRASEHIVWMELRAFLAYREPDLPFAYWRSASGFEVDFVLGDRTTGHRGEKRPCPRIRLKGLSALSDDGPVAQRVVVSLENEGRVLTDRHGPVTSLPLVQFVERLGGGS